MVIRFLVAAAAMAIGLPNATVGRAQVPAPTMATSADPWAVYIAEAAARFGIPERWIREVMRAESAGHALDEAGRPLTSRAGAIGLMQVMPATYAALARTYGLGPDPTNPRDNILAGAAYLRLMYDRFGSPGFLAAYNAGPGRYAAHLASGAPLPAETRAYLATVSARLEMASGMSTPPGAIAPPDTLFSTAKAPSDQLFFALRSSARSEGKAEQ